MIEIKNLSRTSPSISNEHLNKIAIQIVGAFYTVSVVYIGDGLSKTLNGKYRGKNSPTTILSFSVADKEGEIFLNLHRIKKEAKKRHVLFRHALVFFFIHGLLHLKGCEHNVTMEGEEDKILARYHIPLSVSRSWRDG